MRVLDALWVIAPPNGVHIARPDEAGQVLWSDLLAFLGVGGIWVFLYLRTLGTEPMMPLNASDQPDLIEVEARNHGNHGTTAHAL
jgi:hypothetical protein